MFCPKCGKKREDTWILCPFCGTKLPSQMNDSTRNVSDLYPESKEIGVETRSTKKTNISGNWRTTLCIVTEKMEEFFSTGKTMSTPSKLKKEVKVTELGNTYSLLILELTKIMFDNTKMMNELGIKKSNESVKELHILNYYFIMRSIIDSFIDDNLKTSLISRVLDRYIGLVIDYHRDVKKMDEQSLFREMTEFKHLIYNRINSYDKVFHKLMVNDIPSNLEGGRILINTLEKILPQKNIENVFDILPFHTFFSHSLDITRQTMNIHNYRIIDVSLGEEFQDSFDRVGVNCEVLLEKNGKYNIKFK